MGILSTVLFHRVISSRSLFHQSMWNFSRCYVYSILLSHQRVLMMVSNIVGGGQGPAEARLIYPGRADAGVAVPGWGWGVLPGRSPTGCHRRAVFTRHPVRVRKGETLLIGACHREITFQLFNASL